MLAFTIFYVFWSLRVWAGGDSKLFIALAALIPEYPNLGVLPRPVYSNFFFLTILSNLLIVYLAYILTLISADYIKKQKLQEFIYGFAIYLLGISTILLGLHMLGVYSISPGYPLLIFTLSALYIYNEASKLGFTKTVRISDLETGDNLAERIILEDGKASRVREGNPSLSSLVKELLRGDFNAIVKPTPQGVTVEEKTRLMDLVKSRIISDEISIYPGNRMSPMIFASLLISVFVGDLFGVGGAWS